MKRVNVQGKETNRLVDIHLRRTLLVLGWWWWRSLVVLLILLGRASGRRDHRWLRLGPGQDRNREVDNFVSLLLDLGAREDGVDVLWSLILANLLVAEPLLNGRDLLDDGLLVLLINVSVLFVRRGRLGHIVVQGLLELGGRLLALVELAVSEGDGIAQDLEGVQSRNVSRLGGILAFLRVQPVFSLAEASKEFLLFGGLDEGGIPIVELATGVVNILLEGILAILQTKM